MEKFKDKLFIIPIAIFLWCIVFFLLFTLVNSFFPKSLSIIASVFGSITAVIGILRFVCMTSFFFEKSNDKGKDKDDNRKPVETKSVKTKSTETKSTETKPVETKPAETKKSARILH